MTTEQQKDDLLREAQTAGHPVKDPRKKEDTGNQKGRARAFYRRCLNGGVIMRLNRKNSDAKGRLPHRITRQQEIK